MQNNDNFWMQRCLDIAQRAAGNTFPNPMVGAVIVHNNELLAEGWHKKAGTEHAEVAAMNNLAPNAIALLPQAQMYVTLEPCAHFGRTAPCADMLVQSGIGKVIIGTLDPYPLVAGKGLKKLLQGGVQVKFGVLQRECETLNKRFFCAIKNQLPYVVLKWAQTANGFFAPETPQAYWISNALSRRLVHRWRSEEQAILVGGNTVLADNPQLTNRYWYGNQPTKVLIDTHGNLAETAAVFAADTHTLVVCPPHTRAYPHAEQVYTEDFSPQNILAILQQKNIQSVLIEGGAKTLQAFINANSWNEARIIIAENTYWEKGIFAPKLSLRAQKTNRLLDNRIEYFYNDSLK